MFERRTVITIITMSLSLLLKMKLYNILTTDISTVQEAHLTSLTGQFTVSWQDVVADILHNDRPFTVFQLAVHSVDMVGSAPEGSHGILVSTMLFLNTY